MADFRDALLLCGRVCTLVKLGSFKRDLAAYCPHDCNKGGYVCLACYFWANVLDSGPTFPITWTSPKADQKQKLTPYSPNPKTALAFNTKSTTWSGVLLTKQSTNINLIPTMILRDSCVRCIRSSLHMRATTFPWSIMEAMDLLPSVKLRDWGGPTWLPDPCCIRVAWKTGIQPGRGI